MLYLVEAHASIDLREDRAGPVAAIDPIPVLRFHPEAMYGNPTRRQVSR